MQIVTYFSYFSMTDSGSGGTFALNSPSYGRIFTLVFTAGPSSGPNFFLADGVSQLSFLIAVYGVPDATSTLVCSQDQFLTALTLFPGSPLSCVITPLRKYQSIFTSSQFFTPSVSQNNGNFSALSPSIGSSFAVNFIAGLAELSSGFITDSVSANVVNIKIISSGIITLDGGVDGYLPVQNLTWSIVAPPAISNYLIVFTLNWLDIESQVDSSIQGGNVPTACNWDYLALYSGPRIDQSKKLAQLCAGGVKAVRNSDASQVAVSDVFFLCNSSVATVNFISDKSNQRRGFELNYKFVSSIQDAVAPTQLPPQTIYEVLKNVSGTVSFLKCLLSFVFI